MKAAVLKKYGSVDQFEVKQMPVPELKDGQIIVRNYASSVNPIDTKVRQGKMKLLSGMSGEKILGSDFSGVVMASRSRDFKIGDEVFGFMNSLSGSAYAEIVLADEKNTVHKPTNLSFTEAAVLPLVALTAWKGLVTEGKIQKGDRVLILGCTGGVGSVAVQIAKTFGAVISGSCSGKNTDFAREIGCELVYDYETQTIPETAVFDLIFDATGMYHLKEYEKHLTAEAMFVSTKGGARDFMNGVEAAFEVAFKKKMKLIVVKPNKKDLLIVKSMIENGQLRPIIAKTFPIELIGEAHQMMEIGGFTGKIAIEI